MASPYSGRGAGGTTASASPYAGRGATEWNVNRLGTAAAVTAPPGTPPAYGTAFDLSSLWMDPETFADFARTIAEVRQRETISMMEQGVDLGLRQRELEIARNYEESGYSMEDSAFANEGDDDESWFTEYGNNLLTDARKLRNLAGRGISNLTEFQNPDELTYEAYAAKGGLLTEAEWSSFSPNTRVELFNRAKFASETRGAVETPGISHALDAFMTGYRGLTTAGDMTADLRGRVLGEESTGSLRRDVGMFFNRSKWGDAWKESEERSFGNALIDNLLSPAVAEETLDRWRKTNSWYQISSFGSEFAATWYLDGGVVAARGLGGVARVARNEIPLNESGQVARSIREAQQGREITTRTPLVRQYASWRAERVLEGQKGVEEYAKAVPFDQFARLPMFRNRQVDGIAGAKALHIAANSDNPELLDLTWRAFAGDRHAFASIQKLKTDPAEAAKFGDGAQTFIDAVNATKTRATVLDNEIAALKNDTSGTPFHRWEVHADIKVKEEQLAQAKAVLDGYDADYLDWLNLVDGEYTPQLGRFKAPSVDKVERFGDGTKRRFYMNNQFGYSHQIVKLPKAAVMRKSGTAALHDLDSSARTVNRYFNQLGQILDFDDADNVRAGVIDSLTHAQTPKDRYKILFDMEDNLLIPALASKLGISTATAKGVFDSIQKERNRTIEGVLSGKGRIYQTAPSTAQRITDETSTVRLISEPDEEGMVTFELMDGTKRTTVTTHESQMFVRREPVDVTQTPNYYQPVDVRALYHEMKRHEDVLRDIDAGVLREGAAAIARVHDIIGTKFYNLWKPAQLWRLGWPQRVLMDEGLRAMSIFGPMYWLTGPGADAALTAVRNVPGWISDRRHPLNLGAGPANPKTAPFNAFKHDGEMSRAVQYEGFAYPKVNPSRLNRLQKVGDAYRGHWRSQDAFEAYGKAHPRPEAPEELAAWEAEHLPRITASDERARSAREAIAGLGDPLTTLEGTFKKWKGKPSKTPLVVDPATGKATPTGYAVPIPDLSDQRIPADDLGRRNLAHWYQKNAELLSRTGVRLLVNPDGKIEIARVFTGRNARRRATEELARVARSRPVGQQNVEMFDLAKGERFAAEDVDALPSFMGQLYDYLNRGDDVTREEFDALKGAVEQAIRDEGDRAPLLDELKQALTAAEARRTSGALRAQEVDPITTGDMVAALENFDFQVTDPVAAVVNRLRKKYGSGFTTIRAQDGTTVRVPNAFEGHVGEIMRGLVSSAKAIDDLTAGHGGALSLMRRQAAGHKTYKPPVFDEETLTKGTKKNKAAVHYFHQWSDLVNDQIGNSPIWSRMLTGKSDAEITEWLVKSPEGSAVRREIIPEGQSVELYVNQHRSMLNYYVPSAKVQRLLAKGRITPADLRRNVHNDDLPDIFGPDVELLSGNRLNRLADGIWKTLGTIPIDKLSRQPFAKAVYDAKMNALISSAEGKFLTDDAIQRFQKIAHQHTLNEVRRTLFDLTDATNMTDAIRFIAPFWNAQQEAMTKWARIISDRPETVVRFFNGQRAVYKNFIVVDEDNNEVDSSAREGGLYGLGVYHPEDKVIINVPEWMRKTPLGKGLEHIGTLGIPLGSANTVLQGEMPVLPSPGPWLTIPADKFLRTVSETQGVTHDEDFLYRWLFPIGRPSGGTTGVLEQLSPGWGRRALGATGGEDSVAWVNLYTQIGREMHLEAQQKGLPEPTPEEIDKAANFLWGVRMFTSFVSPVQTEFRPKHQFWVDEAHRYRNEIGPDWFDQYVADYGKEAAIYAVSSSNATAGVPPTKQGMEEWDVNSSLIQKYPEWGEAIISPDAYSDDYSQDAYRAQFDITLGPGDSRTLRALRDPSARFAEAEKRLGWLEFRKIDATVEAELAARGLTSIQQSEAADLAYWQSQQRALLSEQYPEWRKDYDVRENSIDQQVRELSSFAFDSQFDKRPDFQGVRQYLIIRDQATEVLQGRYAQGGSRSLQSEENADLSQWFYANVGALIQENPAFAEFYSRHLDADQLLTGGM